MAIYTTFRENFLRVVAVLGLIAILLLGAWGIIQLAFYLPTFFSNWGKPKETLTVRVPAQTTSDKAFVLSWSHAGKDTGGYSYSVSYSCAGGEVSFAAPVPTGAYQLVKCDVPFNYVGATSSMPLIPVLGNAGIVKASKSITVSATKLQDGTVSVKDTATVSINASTTPTTAPTASAPTDSGTTKPDTKPAPTKPATTYVPSGRTTNLFGYADLAVQITSAPQAASAGSRVSLQFVVTNAGTNVAPAGWSFVATLPYNPIYVYPSGGQQALYPGDKIVYTLGFDVVPTYDYYGSAQASIQVDPNNFVQESVEYNNAASATYQVY